MYDGKYLTKKVPKLDDSGEWQNIAYRVGIQEIIDRLAEYEDAEKQGRLTEVRYGRWENLQGNKYHERDMRILSCSLCRNFLDMSGVNAGRGDANYCPNCGAKMDGGQDDGTA